MAAHLARPFGPGAIALLSFLTPLWLLGLALLPLIRWLHRGGQHRRDVPVSRLALWRGSEASVAAAGERRPPDPAWRRRAVLLALLLIALAGPQWPEQRVRVTLWVDDSLSMLTREAQGPRLAAGLTQARALLVDLAHADVEVRSLSDPWHRFATLDDGTSTAVTAGAGRREPSPPPAALLRRDTQQWLLTDGADATLLAWPGGRRPDRVVQVGSVTRNVGLERLSARRRPDDPDQFDLLLKVTNGGTAAEERTVVFTAGTVERSRSSVRLEPGTSRFVEVSIPASVEVHATLQPGDALAEDDQIALDLTPLRRRRVALDPSCPSALLAAVRAHPALAPTPLGAVAAEALVDCGGAAAAKDVPTIRVVADRAPSQPRGSVQWSPGVFESRRIALEADRLQVAARLQARPGDTVLMAVGDDPVVVARAGETKLLETSLDFGAMAATRGPEAPLLLNLLLERLLDQRVLDETASIDRGPRSTFVAPLPEFGAAAAAAGASESRSLRDDSRVVLLLALLALLWEIVALARQGWRLRAPVDARSS